MEKFYVIIQALLLYLFSSLVVVNAATGEAFDEDEIKVAYLYNFLKFTTWPESAFGPETATVNICAVGDNPLSGKLELLRGKEVRQKTVAVFYLPRVIFETVRNNQCHLLFVSKKISVIDAYIGDLRGSPLLLVGDAENFTDTGGIIGLKLVGQKIRFDINLQRAQENNILFSSLLLKLASNLVGE